MNSSTFGYRTRPKPPGNREIRRLLVADAIGQAHEDSRCTYGYRPGRAALHIERNVTVNHKLVARVMRDLGLTGLPRKTTRKWNLISVRTSSDLVNQNFTTDRPNQFWVIDITEHPLIEGTVSACVVLDVFLGKLSAGRLTGGRRQAWSTRLCSWPTQAGNQPPGNHPFRPWGPVHLLGLHQ